MTNEDIIRMAMEAKLCDEEGYAYSGNMPDIECFANLVAAAEREACAKVCEEAHWSLDDRNEYAAAIRARGNSESN